MDKRFRVNTSLFQRSADKPSEKLKDLDDLDAKVERLFSGQDLLFERLHTEPKFGTRLHKAARDATHSASRYVKKQPVLVKVIAIVVLSLGSGGLFYVTHNNSPANPSVSEVAGVSDGSGSTDPNETVTDKPSFSVLHPSGKNLADLEGRERESPGGERLYSFADTLDGVRIEVTQQAIPESLKTDREKKIQELALGFNAPNVIQVDATTVYHGFSDKTKYQTIIFSKNDLLVFILSPQKITDDAWAGYISSLL